MRRSTKAQHRGRTAAYLGLAALDVALAATGRDRLRRVTKPLLMPALLAGRDPATRRALVLGWGGDVALLGRGDAAFTAGLASFLTGHVAWIVALRRRGDGGQLRRRWPVAAGEVLAHAAITRYLWSRTGPQRLPVAVYSTALLAMSLVALDSRSRRTAAGGLLFLASDAVLALEKFGDLELPYAEPFVMATYTAAQALLADQAPVVDQASVTD